VKRWLGMVGVIGLMVLAMGAVSAEAAGDCGMCAKANDDSSGYLSHSGNTLLRGVTNTGLGWFELFNQPSQASKNGENIGVGILKGVGYSVKRTLKGAGEILTFWVPASGGSYLHIADNCPFDMND